jgi:UDP-N-acetyl-D-galactosamine dehydrogenase
MAVAHNEFKSLGLDGIKKLFKDSRDENKVFLDVKGLYKIDELESSGLKYWRL